ncbi:NUDIX hydrolase [Actinomycetaceae bacterium MB13-C1-2]|nr:NUDIX hydrolase [Actinomycetaceae bacterium MB13-C1-2]
MPYVAVIKRKNRSGRYEWCLPKGHLERGETATEAAVREVAEETGIRTRVVCHISSVDYWFSGSQTRIHKMVHHFLLEYLDGEITAENDPDHEAEDALWVPLQDATRSLSYANERRVARAALALLYPDGNDT